MSLASSRRALAAAWALPLVAATAGPVQAGGVLRGPAALRTPEVRSASLPSQLLFVPLDNGTVQIYPLQNPASGPVAQISGLPGIQQQTVTDANGDLFVANNSNVANQTAVEEFAPPYTAPPVVLSTTWDNALFYPIGVAVDRTGTVYVSSCGTHCFEVRGVLVYPPGATSPASLITTSGFDSLGAMTIDPNGDLFVVNYDEETQAGTVFEVPAGSTTPQDLQLRGLFGGRTAGVAVAPDGDLFVSNPTAGANFILEYKPGHREPSRQIAMGSWFMEQPLMIDFGPDQNLYVPLGCSTTCPLVEGFQSNAKRPFLSLGSEGVAEVPSVATYPNLDLAGSPSAQHAYDWRTGR